MDVTLDPIDARLLGDWQRNFPLELLPFERIGAAIGITGDSVIARLNRLAARGAVSRVGAALRPNTAGASTLAAVAAPEMLINEVAEAIGAQPGVNHSYLRENAWNLWFVATGPDRAHVDATLARIATVTGLTVLDLPLVRPYHIDLGFSLDGASHTPRSSRKADLSVIRPGDHEILQALTEGLELVERPYAALALRLGRCEAEVMARIGELNRAGVISRFGVIVRHRALGWRANAMVVWEVPDGDVDRAGLALAAQPGVTLCYRRRSDLRHWPYNIYCMVHSRSRDDALAKLGRAAEAAGLTAYPRQVLFSVCCYKQTGALVSRGREVAA